MLGFDSGPPAVGENTGIGMAPVGEEERMPGELGPGGEAWGTLKVSPVCSCRHPPNHVCDRLTLQE